MSPPSSSRSGASRAIVVVGLGVFVLGVYVLVVLGGGALIGRTDSPSPVLSVLATTVVALAFAPVQGVLERAAARHIATPYDVLTRFAENVGDTEGSHDLPTHMSRLLAQGTGAQWAQVWLQAVRPPDGRRTVATRCHSMTAHHPCSQRLDPQQSVRTVRVRRLSATATRCWVCSGSRSGPGFR